MRKNTSAIVAGISGALGAYAGYLMASKGYGEIYGEFGKIMDMSLEALKISTYTTPYIHMAVQLQDPQVSGIIGAGSLAALTGWYLMEEARKRK